MQRPTRFPAQPLARKSFLMGAIISCLAIGWTSTALATHTLSGIDFKTGKDVTVLRDDPAKKATVLVFMSSSCPCSISHGDEVVNLSKDFPEFRFIGINSNAGEELADAKTYFSRFPFLVLRDQKAILANEFKALKTPHAFILTSDGKQVFQGGVSDSSKFSPSNRRYLREALEDIRANRAIGTPIARALGCSIERPR